MREPAIPGFFRLCLLAVTGWLLAGASLAEVVELEMAGGLPATAELLEGDAEGADPVLILHGFLQTREFATVRRLGEALNEAGYMVLLPTLSLGVPRRSQSLQCEALHLHDLDGDGREVARWVEWLSRRTGRRVAVIGHNAGGVVLSRYLARYPDAPVARAIMLSIAPR